MRGVFGFGLFSLALAACDPTAGNKAPPEPPAPPAKAVEIGSVAPAFAVINASTKGGAPIRPVPGKVNILFFFATWSAPDKQQLSKMPKVYERERAKGLALAAVCIDDELRGVDEFAREDGVTFEVGWDEGHKVANAYRPSTVPTTYVIDRKGIVRYIHHGYHDGEDDVIAKEVESLL